MRCEAAGHVRRAPSYNSIFRYIERPSLTPLLKTLVEESATPLRAVETTFAQDGTGFATNTYARWFDHKYGEEKRTQVWVKAHAMVGTQTNIVTSAKLTQRQLADKLDAKVQYIQQVEAGRNLSIKSLVKFANALGVRPHDLLRIES